METLFFIVTSAISGVLFRRYVEPHLLQTLDLITKPEVQEEPTEIVEQEQQFKYKISNGYITIDFSRTQWPS